MKNLFFVITITLLFAACKKQELILPVADEQKEPALNGIPSPVPAYFWRQVSTGFPNQYPYNYYTSSTIVMKVNEDVYLLAGSVMEYVYRFNHTLRKFEPHTFSSPSSLGFTSISFGGYKYFFSYGSKIYGGSASHQPDGFFSIDPETGINQSLERYPGVYDQNPISFTVGNKGYVISGYTSTETSKVWEYDFAANTWTNIGNSPLGKRTGGVAFVLNSKVYMGLGYENVVFNGQTIRVYKKDWIEYTPGASYHAVKANFPGTGRTRTLGFIMNNSLYLGFGSNESSGRFKDFWKYNSSANTWTQQADWPGAFDEGDPNAGYISPRNVVIFSSGSRGYLVRGALNQFWHFTNSFVVTPVN
jgi:Galactose oxidase, central domain